MRITFDTNILVYAVDADAGEKHSIAVELLGRAAECDCILTLQSLAEFFNVVTRKANLDARVAASFVEDWRAVFQVGHADEETLVDAMSAVMDHGLKFWDAMIWAMARQAGCRFLLSEDFQDGRALGGVVFVNPLMPGNHEIVNRALTEARTG